MATPRNRTHFIIGLLASFIESLKRDMVGEAGAVTDPQHDHGGATGSSGTGAVTGTSASGTAATTAAKIRQQVRLNDLAAPGTALHAQVVGGAGAIDVNSGFTQILPHRTVQVVASADVVACNVTIDGTDLDGAAVQEVIPLAGGVETVQGTLAFATITRLRTSIEPGPGTATIDLQTGNGFSIGARFSDADLLAVAQTVEAIVSSDGPTGTIVPTTAPDGSRDYTVRYRVQPTVTDGGHTHAAGTLAGPAHTHPVAAGATGVTVAGGGTAVHYDQAEYAVDTAIASDLATSIALTKALIYAYLRHVADTLAHAAADTTNDLDDGVAAEMAADVVDLNSAIEVANGIKAAYNAHRSQAGVHPTNDAGHAITSLDATDQGSLNTLVNELKTDLNAHMAAGLSTPSWRVES